jgi:addiction module HigA family antidote
MHPGELLREEILPALGRPKTEITRLLGVSRQALYDLIEEKQPVTPVMALRLGKAETLRSAARRTEAQPADQGHSEIESGIRMSAYRA